MSINYETPMGLLKRWDFETEPENSFLYGLQHFMLTNDAKRQVALTRYLTDVYYDSAHTHTLIYNNHVDETQALKTPYVSHDQLTAYAVFDMVARREIWEGMKAMKFRYDNLNPQSPKMDRLLHPRDILWFGIQNSDVVCTILSPLLYLMMVYTMVIPKRLKKRDGKWKLEKKNSNEILWWLRVQVMEGVIGCLFKRSYNLLLRLRFKNLHGLMIDYYVDPEHPVCLAALASEGV